MKFVKFPISVLTDSRLSANDMRVLAWLIYRSTPNPDNKCWPSIRKLSEDTGIHKKKIPFYTKRLVNFGWIEKNTEGKGGVKNPQIIFELMANIYCLDLVLICKSTKPKPSYRLPKVANPSILKAEI